MLRSLAIRDFTIIDELELEFGDGFGAITGETGAGKSILIDALAQLLGDRGDSSLVAQGRERADLSATFELKPEHAAHHWLKQQELPEEPSLLLRRVLPADGASRAWINGQPVTITQLRELGRLLIEIHGQHQHQALTQPQAQREWLDRHVDTDVLDAVRSAAEEHRAIEREQAALDELAGNPAEAELLRFQLDELERLGLTEGEFESLEQQQRRLSSVDELRRAIDEALEALEGESRAAASQVHVASRALQPMSEREPTLAEGLEMLTTAATHIEETARLLKRLADGLENDPVKLAENENRLSRALDLSRKHRVSAAELPELTSRLGKRLQRIDDHEGQQNKLAEKLGKAEQRWKKHAHSLSRARQKAAQGLATRTQEALAELGMTAARVAFTVEPDPNAAIAVHGSDRIDILFSANAGQEPRPLGRTASGGELSRFSLALIIAGGENACGRVRIFDEIDAGVGGETAHSVGRFLRRAASGGQAFCVTHLAQVAASAHRQWQVRKRQQKSSTRVEVEVLDRPARIAELARMLGSSTSKTSRQHAEAMLEENSSRE